MKRSGGRTCVTAWFRTSLRRHALPGRALDNQPQRQNRRHTLGHGQRRHETVVREQVAKHEEGRRKHQAATAMEAALTKAIVPPAVTRNAPIRFASRAP